MDACESEKQSTTTGTTRQPLVSANNKNGTAHKSQTREASSRYMSPTPTPALGPKRCISPIATRTSSAFSTASVPKRAISAERKRPSTPSSPRSQSPSSTPVRDTAADTMVASRKAIGNKMPESLWPSTMRSLGSSFQSDTSSVSSTKREPTVSCTPADRTLRPSSNIASRGETSSPRKAMPERKNGLPKGNQLENSKPVDSLNARKIDQHRWPSKTSAKTFTALSKSDIIDKLDKTSLPTNSGLFKSPLRRLSLDVSVKSDNTEKIDRASVLSLAGMVKPSPGRLSLDGTIEGDKIKGNVADKMGRPSDLFHSEKVKPSPRRLSLDGAVKSEITDMMDKTSVLSQPGIIKPSSPRRFSLDGAAKSDFADEMNRPSSIFHSGMAKPSSVRLSMNGTVKSDHSEKMDRSQCGMPKPFSPRRLSLDAAVKSDITDQMEKSVSSQSGMVKPSSPRRLSLNGAVRSEIADKMNKISGSSHSGMVRPSSPRRLSLDGAVKSEIADTVDKTLGLSHSVNVKPSSQRRSSLDGAVKSDIANKVDRISGLSHSGIVKPSSPRRISLDGAVKSDIASKVDKTSGFSHSGIVKPSAIRRLSLDTAVKSDIVDKMDKTSGMVKPSSPRRLPLIRTTKSSVSSHSETVKPSSPQRPSPDGSITSDTTDEMEETPYASVESSSSTSSSRRSLDETAKSDDTNDQMDKTSVFPHASMVEPSLRRQSLDGSINGDTGDHMEKLPFLSPSEVATPSPRRFSLDEGIKTEYTDKMDQTSLLSNSASGKSSPGKLSKDGTSKPLKKSATQLLMELARKSNVKEMLFGRSVDDGSSRTQKPSLSSSYDRASSANAAARSQSSPVPPPRLPSLSATRGVSPARVKSAIPSSRGTSAVGVRPSSPSQEPQNSSSVLSFMADVKKENSAANVEDVHQFRMLYNRHLQWRFANARADDALLSQKVKAEKMLYNMCRDIADMWVKLREKRSNFQQLGIKLKLYATLRCQINRLKEWTSIERDHMNTVNKFIQILQASIILIPLSRGARGNANSVKAALYSAAHVMQTVGSSFDSVLSRLEEINRLVAEIAEVTARERAMLNECESLLHSANAYQVEEIYIRTLILQMKQGC